MVSARDKLRAYFLDHVGEVINTHDLAKVAGISEYGRRIRELRKLEGLDILTHRDLAELKPGQYILKTTKRLPTKKKAISTSLRARILEKDGYTCQVCGRGPEDPDPIYPGKKTILNVDHRDPLGPNDETNLRTICARCNEGKSDREIPRETINLLSQIRKASREVQYEVYQFLKRKFSTKPQL